MDPYQPLVVKYGEASVEDGVDSKEAITISDSLAGDHGSLRIAKRSYSILQRTRELSIILGYLKEFIRTDLGVWIL